VRFSQQALGALRCLPHHMLDYFFIALTLLISMEFLEQGLQMASMYEITSTKTNNPNKSIFLNDHTKF
jgi:hypothetical protein